jgi:DNA-binding CsgD family transcriptional regulator
VRRAAGRRQRDQVPCRVVREADDPAVGEGRAGEPAGGVVTVLDGAAEGIRDRREPSLRVPAERDRPRGRPLARRDRRETPAKDRPPWDVGAAIMDLVAGGSPISPAIARHLLQRFAPPPAPPARGTEALTAREHEVLDLLAKGLTYDEAAETLHVSFHTIASHVKHIYGKLAVRSRSEAVYEATQLGILKLR